MIAAKEYTYADYFRDVAARCSGGGPVPTVSELVRAFEVEVVSECPLPRKEYSVLARIRVAVEVLEDRDRAKTLAQARALVTILRQEREIAMLRMEMAERIGKAGQTEVLTQQAAECDEILAAVSVVDVEYPELNLLGGTR